MPPSGAATGRWDGLLASSRLCNLQSALDRREHFEWLVGTYASRGLHTRMEKAYYGTGTDSGSLLGLHPISDEDAGTRCLLPPFRFIGPLLESAAAAALPNQIGAHLYVKYAWRASVLRGCCRIISRILKCSRARRRWRGGRSIHDVHALINPMPFLLPFAYKYKPRFSLGPNVDVLYALSL